ncbi:MAG: hypothetical protein IKI84_12160 [Clostridia bacterium]|nr:hypothetical protein [Clostridia bacterium]
MKKRIIAGLLTIFCLSFCAQGFALPPIASVETPRVIGELPDPGTILGTEGKLHAEDYVHEENGITYDCFIYTRPAKMDPSDVIKSYASLAAEAGYELWFTAVEKYEAFAISEEDIDNTDPMTTALLIPDYEGYVYFMVPKGMSFSLKGSKASPQAENTPRIIGTEVATTVVTLSPKPTHVSVVNVNTPAPTVTPEPRENYVSMDINGWHYESVIKKSYDTGAKYFSGLNQYSQRFQMETGCPIQSIQFFWPAEARPGGTYTVRQSDGSKSMWDSPNGTISVLINDNQTISNGKFDAAYYSNGRRDYFTLTIDRYERTNDGILIEASFEGKIYSAVNNSMEITNGFFSVYYYGK